MTVDLLPALTGFIRWKLPEPPPAFVTTQFEWPQALEFITGLFRGYCWVSVTQAAQTRIFGIVSLDSPWQYGLAQVESALFAPQAEVSRLRGIESRRIRHFLILQVVDAYSARAMLAVQSGPDWHVVDEHTVAITAPTMGRTALRRAPVSG